MFEWPVIAAIFALGAASYAMRAGGFLTAGGLPRSALLARLLRLAPGNLCAAFAAAGILQGGWPSLAGCVGAVVAMAATKREWAALAVGFACAASIAAMR
jgi:branched-subunit amino acid transport protein